MRTFVKISANRRWTLLFKLLVEFLSLFSEVHHLVSCNLRDTQTNVIVIYTYIYTYMHSVLGDELGV